MQPDIRSLDLKLTPALVEHVQQQLQQALGRLAPQIQSVRVRVNDVNGPRGGNDKRCRMEARLERGGRVFAEKVDADLYAAINVAASRLKRAVGRQSERGHRAELRMRVSAPGLST